MKTGKKILSMFLVVLMLLTAVLLQGLTGIELPWTTKAQAAGVAGYNAIAAAQWARDHVYDTWSCLHGEGYWEPETGDCANFVSQCIYMGGINMNTSWHHFGYKARYNEGYSQGSWIRAQRLYDYVVSIGGVDIYNPASWQVEVGDLLFFYSPELGRYRHSAIVVGVNGGAIEVAYHSDNRIRVMNYDWHCGYANNRTHLVKMYGSTCTNQTIRELDVYIALYDTAVFSQAGGTWQVGKGFLGNDYVHVYQTKVVNGTTWGYTLCRPGYYGWVNLNNLRYVGHAKSGPVPHIMGNWYVKVQPTCSTAGIEERVCSRCGYAEQRNLPIGGKHIKVVDPTCLEPGYCLACGATTATALGHDTSGKWKITIEPTCTEKGEKELYCKRVSNGVLCDVHLETAEVPALGHDYIAGATNPTCVENGTKTYKCSRCDSSYVDYIDESNTWSDWTTEIHDLPDDKVKSKQEYRFSDKSTTTSYETAIDGWTKDGGKWVASDSGTIDYIPSWPVGFNQSSPYYSMYNKTPYSASETETKKTTVSTTTVGHVYWHWCRGTRLGYDDPNRVICDTSWESAQHTTWHATFDTAEWYYSSESGYNCYINFCANSCADTQYWFGLDVKRCSYTNYKKLFNYYKWSDWSKWQDEPVEESDTKKVETRTVYSYDLAALGHDFSVAVDGKAYMATDKQLELNEDGTLKNPKCYLTGYVCSRCGAQSPNSEVTNHIIPDWETEKDEYQLVSDANSTTEIYRGYCKNGCGCYVVKAVNNCNFESEREVDATCTTDGYITYVCSVHGEMYTEKTDGKLGHHCSDSPWEIIKEPTCTEKGRKQRKCIRYDEGITCDYIEYDEIPAIGHSNVKFAENKATCEKDGNSEYYYCTTCLKYFSDVDGKNEIKENSWIIEATGHSGLDASGNEVWVKESEAGCGVTGRECVYCLNEWCDYDVECDNDSHEGHHYLIKDREIEEIKPNYAIVDHKDSTCIDLGYDIWQCLNCYGTDNEHGWSDMLPLKEHDWGEPTTTYATCTEGGTETVICNYCKLKETSGTSDATGHALSPLDEGYADSDDKMELISSVKNVCGSGSIDTYQCTHINQNTNERCTYKVVIGEASDHNLGDYVITLEPTCTEDGYKHKECKNDGCEYRTDDEIIPATGHDWEFKNTVAPTCETSGYDHYVCKNDSSHEYDNYNKSMLGHEADGKWVVTKEPTCAEKGEEQCKCVRYDDGVTCEKIYTREISIDKDAHDWDDGVINPSSTCNTHGTKTYICKNDSNHTYTEEVPLDPNNHVGKTYLKDNKAPKCTEDGYTGDTYCSDCDALLQKGEPISATGHDYGSWVDDKNGTTHTKTCQRDICNDTVTEHKVSANHKMSETERVPAKCTVDGYVKYDCSDCDYTYTEPLTATGHDYGEWIKNDDGTHTKTCSKDSSHTVTEKCNFGEWETTLEPKCTEKGEKERVCTDCGYVEKSEVPAKNHDWDDGVINPSSTCNTHGTKTYICKNDSNHTYTEEVPLDPNNHVGKTYLKDNKAPKCTEDGYTGDTYCSDCDALLLKGEPISATGHDYGEWIKNDDGTHTKTCSKDSSHTVTEKCNFGEWETTLEPKCTEKGEKERVCTDCGYVEKSEVPAKNHDWDDGVINPSSTCNTHGTKTYTCKNDSNHTYTEEVPLDPKNHVGKTYLKDNKAPKCTEDGYTGDTYCSDCDALLQKGEPISATGHDYGSWVDDKNGTTHTKTCQRDICNDTVTEHKVSANHKMSETERVPAKCTVDGYVKYDCSDCDYTYTEPLKATGHDYGKWIKNDDGTHTKTCSKDSSHTVTEKCNFGEWETTLEPKCTEKGEKERVCTDCGYVEKSEVPAKNHDWGEWKVTKEPTYDETGIKKQICANDSSHIKEDIIPVLTRESEENDNVKTDKTVDYNELTGEAVIRLTASSNGEKIVTKSRIPLDIVLVLDQSGSMEGRPNTELKKAATTFVNSIYADAVDNNLDHRVAMVGFAMQNQGNYSSDYHQYLNTEVLSTGSDPIEYGKATNATYKNALVSVNKDNKLNPVLTTAIGNIAAKGATATDLGLDMACKIFSQNENDGTRKRIVVLMSDGVPTYSDVNTRKDVEEATNNAKFNAELLKNTYNADVYSVGLLSGLGDDVIRYGEYVTYGKQYGKSFLENIASKNSEGKSLYYDCNDADALVTNFNKIAEESTIIRSDFDDVTLIDTVSNAFTLTSKQENQLRINAINNLGVTNEDITIARFDDGTTQVKIRHISPKKVEQANGVKFVIDVSFNVTANENALVADSYVTNTDNAGVIVGVKDVYENNFAAPSDNVEEAQGVIYFNINGITYHVLRVHAGDKIEQPEINLEGGYTFSGWDLPDEVTFEGGKYTVDATLTQDAYTVTWVVDGENIVDSYHCGDIISVPKVIANSQGDEFTSWDGEIPSTMPARNLVFTAVYTKHVHQWVTSTASSGKNETAYSNVYCKNCGASPDNSLSYTLTATSGRKTYTYNLKLVDAQNITIDVDGNITISLPIPSEMRYARNITVSRREADGTLTVLDAVKNGNYITFTTDHFSEYILSAAYDCDETGKHIDNNCDTYCDTCGVSYSNLGHSYDVLSKTPATCTKDGYTTYKCSKCGNTYDGDKVTAPGHKDADGDGKCDTCGQSMESIVDSCGHLCHSTSGFMKFIWKIAKFFYKLFGTNKYCSCGVKHW